MARPKNNRVSLGCLLVIIIFLLIIRGATAIISEYTQRRVEVTSDDSFFEVMAPYAKREGREHGLYPSIILAQSALESNYANSRLSSEFNNYFGIKAFGDREGVSLETFEYIEGNRVDEPAKFRVYDSISDSFKDYGNLVGNAQRYEPYRNAKSLEEAAYSLYECGYSTDPNYGDKLLNIIRTNNLTEYD